MFEMLIDFVNDRLKMAKEAVQRSTRIAFFHQAFGAVSFFCDNAETQAQEEMAGQLWDKDWRPAFLDLIMEAEEE